MLGFTLSATRVDCRSPDFATTYRTDPRLFDALLSGDSNSLAIGINDASQVVGSSLSADFSTLTAVLWENGEIADVNKFVAVNPAGLYLLLAYSVNSAGEIAGLGVAADGLHGFLATPNSRQHDSPALRSVLTPVLTGPSAS